MKIEPIKTSDKITMIDPIGDRYEYLLATPVRLNADILYAALRNILNGIKTGAITSEHDEVFASAVKQAYAAITKAEGK